MEELQINITTKLNRFVQSKRVKALIESTVSEEIRPSIFLTYPRLFSKYFGITDGQILDHISAAIYIHYMATQIRADEKAINAEEREELLFTLNEEVTQILTAIFNVKSRFWLYWNQRKKEFDKAIQIEISLQNKGHVNTLTYFQLADLKSSFGKVAIDSLHILSDEKHIEVYESLLRSHTQFYRSFQMYDDLKDIKEDCENGQFNWAFFRLTEALGDQQNSIKSSDLKKYLYIKNVGQQILEEAIDSLESASEVLGLSEMTLWKKAVQEVHSELKFYLNTVDDYIKTLRKGLELSYVTGPN